MQWGFAPSPGSERHKHRARAWHGAVEGGEGSPPPPAVSCQPLRCPQPHPAPSWQREGAAPRPKILCPAGIFFATSSPPDPGRGDRRPVSSPAPRGGPGGTKPSARAPAARASPPALSCRHGGSPRGDHGLPGPAEPARQDETPPRRLPHPPVRPSASASIPVPHLSVHLSLHLSPPRVGVRRELTTDPIPQLPAPRLLILLYFE